MAKKMKAALRNEWQKTLRKAVLCNSPIYRHPHELPGPLTVSLTSFPSRFKNLPLTLECLLSQTVKPDNVILWISREEKRHLTRDILDLRDKGLNIEFSDDLKSYLKIVPALFKYPSHFIVTADDDAYYWPTWLEELIKPWNGREKDVVAHRVKRIKLNADKLPLKYEKWGNEKRDRLTETASALNFQVGVGGVMYPPGTFYEHVTKREIYTDICPKADDVWLYWMLRLNGSMVRKTPVVRSQPMWPERKKINLSDYNVKKGGNDRQIKNMIDEYGFPG